MKIVFKRIPKLAQFFYLAGFALITLAFVNYYFKLKFVSEVLNLQIFILGAIVVAIGSVINLLYQFKNKN